MSTVVPELSARPVPDRAVLVVNVRSRKGEALFAECKEKLQAAGVGLIAAHAVRDPSTLNTIVRAAIGEGAPMVIVGGGDGTLSGTVAEFVNKDCVFAVLPLGTANSFCADARAAARCRRRH